MDIERNGYYYEQNDITITGYWAWEKVADMLPYNYMDASLVKREELPVSAPATVPAAGVKPWIAYSELVESREQDHRRQ